MNRLKLPLLIAVICISFSLLAQKPPIKFGDVPLDQIKMTVYDKDSSANAVILTDYGESRLEYVKGSGFKLKFTRHVRIKVLNKNGYEWGNASIYLYHDGSDRENVTGIKGLTYNLDNNKVVKSKLEKDAIFDEKYDENRNITKFSMPDVREGSVIEYTYNITSDFWFRFRSWEFQNRIPIAWSEYRTRIPEYFQYQNIGQGYLPFHVSDQSYESRNITFTNTHRYEGGGFSTGQTQYSTSNVTYREKRNQWVVKDAPAFIDEPFMTTYKNYISKIQFELSYTNFPNSPGKNIMGTWEKLNEQYLEADGFGVAVKSSGFLNKELETLDLEGKSDLDKASEIARYIKSKVTWDGNERYYLDTNLREPLKDGKGTSAEINLLLTSMLQKAGLTADPVMISTREHGIIREQIPNSGQFNYVICRLVSDGKYYLMDATEKYLSSFSLPERCLNGRGFIISKTNSGWVNLSTSQKKAKRISGEITLGEDGIVNGQLKYSYNGYSGLDQRKNYFAKGADDYIEDMKSNSDWEVEDIAIENETDLSKPFVVNYEAEVSDAAESAGNIIYLNPMVSDKYDKNPFTLEKREYPIDFSCPRETLYYVTFNLPEGYQLEAPMKPFVIALPENGGRFTYNITSMGNKLIVMSKLSINKTLFVMDEYPYIKEFFAQIVAKQNEQLVLKKT